MAIGFLTTDLYETPDGVTPGPCVFYRCLLPALTLGVQARVGYPAWDGVRGFGVSDTKQSAIFGFSHVMLKLVMSRWAPRQILIAKQLGQRVVVDVDDHHEMLVEDNVAWHATHPEKNKLSNRDHYAKVIESCDILTVSTPELLDFYKDRHSDIRLIRNGIAPKSFAIRRQERKPVIGWAGSTAHRSGDLYLLRDWLPDFLEKHDLIFHHVGHNPDYKDIAEMIGIPKSRMRYTPMMGMDFYPLCLASFDIGLVPLVDIPFNRAKSNLKGLEYAAAGIPFIANGLPEYQLLADDGVGRIVHSPDDWVKHAEELLDLSVRKKEAAQQRKIVTERHSIIQRSSDWGTVFRE